jgi:protein-disulfide isomerase
MRRTALVGILTLAGAWLASGAPATAEEQLPVKEIERIVREYLLREPQVIYQAIQELQKRQQAEEAVRQKAMIAQNADAIFRHPDDPVAGDPKAEATLVEFFDYHCGYCRSMSPGLRALIDNDPNMRFVFKDLPVLGPDSVTAARAAVAANRLDPAKYVGLHFALMQSKELGREAVLAIAERQGYDRDRLAAEMDSDWVKARIDENLKLAEQLGISGTPSFVVGETLIPGAVDVGQLAQLLEEQRQARN